MNALIDPATQQPVPLGYYIFGAAIAALLGFISTHITLYCYNHCCGNCDFGEGAEKRRAAAKQVAIGMAIAYAVLWVFFERMKGAE
jgi:hypothetical protein